MGRRGGEQKQAGEQGEDQAGDRMERQMTLSVEKAGGDTRALSDRRRRRRNETREGLPVRARNWNLCGEDGNVTQAVPTSGGALATILLREGNTEFNRTPGMISLYYSWSQLMEKCPGQLFSRRSPHIRFPRPRCAPGPSRRAFSIGPEIRRTVRRSARSGCSATAQRVVSQWGRH